MEAIFKALADPTRIRVIERLAQGQASVGELAMPFEMALPSFMQHLRVLEDAGVISSAKQGRTRICELRPEALEQAQSWLDAQREIWVKRLDQLDDYLLTMKSTESGTASQTRTS